MDNYSRTFPTLSFWVLPPRPRSSGCDQVNLLVFPAGVVVGAKKGHTDNQDSVYCAASPGNQASCSYHWASVSWPTLVLPPSWQPLESHELPCPSSHYCTFFWISNIQLYSHIIWCSSLTFHCSDKAKFAQPGLQDSGLGSACVSRPFPSLTSIAWSGSPFWPPVLPASDCYPSRDAPYHGLTWFTFGLPRFFFSPQSRAQCLKDPVVSRQQHTQPGQGGPTRWRMSECHWVFIATFSVSKLFLGTCVMGIIGPSAWSLSSQRITLPFS